MHDVEAEVVHQISDADRHDDRLIGRDLAQRAPVEMIEMRVRHEHEIDLRQMVNFEARLLQPLDHLQPLRPVRIDQDIHLVRLHQERGMPDPGDADLAFADFRKERQPAIAGALGEERGNEDAGEEIALVPVGARPQPDPGGALVFSAIFRGLANDVSPAFFRKRNRHWQRKHISSGG